MLSGYVNNRINKNANIKTAKQAMQDSLLN